MALTDPIDTLAYHQSRLFTTNRNAADTPCAHVGEALNFFLLNDTAPATSPEKEALWFYGMNHGMALISAKRDLYEPLNDYELDFVKTYYRMMAPKTLRAFYYLYIICTREARHNHDKNKKKGELTKLFGESVANFHGGSHGEDHHNLWQAPPATNVGNYCKSLQHVFYNHSWSSGYGGPAWGSVADCLSNFVFGTYTAEMMMDTVWTLCHNNGPIFNKGHCYGGFSKLLLTRILDVQRSGQIPEMILTDKAIAKHVEAPLHNLMNGIVANFPDKIGKYVDWYQVEALGSVSKYPTDKQVQTATHGLSPKASQLQKMEAAAEAAALAAAAKKAADAKKKQEMLEEMKANKLKNAFVVMQKGAGDFEIVEKFIKQRKAA